MAVLKINSFDGLATSLDNPSPSTAQTLKNMVRYRHRGWLEQPDGYTSKYTLPYPSTHLTNIAWKDIHDFFVAEHGGKNITIVIGNYTKVSRYDVGTTINRLGIWMYPYWDGSAWINDWLELTECEIVKLTSLSSTSTLNFAAISGIAVDYFKNWTVVFEDYTQTQAHDSYLLVQSSTTSSVTYFGANASLVRSADAKMILVRSFLPFELPSIVTSHIFNYLNEIRLTTGNTITDVSLMSGFRKKTYSWATSDASVDRIVLDVGCLDTWRYALLMDGTVAVTDPSSPLAIGNYAFKLALGTDDNQIAVAREATAGIINSLAIKYSVPSAGSRIATDGTYIYRRDASNSRLINRYLAKDYVPSVSPTQIRLTDDGSPCLFQDVLVLSDSIYVLWKGSNNTSEGYLYITKISRATFVITTTIQITKTGVTSLFANAYFATDGTYIYISASHQSSYLYMYKYNSALTQITNSVIMPGGHADVVQFVDSMCYGDGYIYTSSLSTGKTTWIIRVDTNLANNIYFDTGNTNMELASMCVSGGFLYNTLVAGRVIIQKRFLNLTGLTEWNVSASATVGILTTDGTTLYAHITDTGYILYKGIDVDGTVHYTSSVILNNSTSNMVVSTYVYGDGFIVDPNPTTFSISCDGTQRIEFRLLVSAGAIPARMRYAYLYINKDGGQYYRLKKIDLTSVTSLDPSIIVTNQPWEATAYYQTTAKHFYHRSTVISVRESDYQLIGAEMSVDMGRASIQSGIVRYGVSGVVGVKTYVGNFYDVYSSQSFKDNVLVNCVSGDGNQQIDVFDYTNPVGVKKGDGDTIVAIADINERVCVLKKRSVIMLMLGSEGGYTQELVSAALGCCSQDSVASFEDTVYWADYNGLHSLNGREVKNLNADWVEDWKALSIAQKEATVSAIDRINKQWIVNTRINTGSVPWAVDGDSPEGDNPIINIVPASITFGLVEIGASSIASYVLSAGDLTPASGNIIITAPAGYQVSTSELSGYASSINVAYTGGYLINTTLYVKFTPLTDVSYGGNISHSGANAGNKNLALTGRGYYAEELTIEIVSTGEITGNTATIIIVTNRATTVAVNYGTDSGSLISSADDPVFSKYHEIVLTGLSSNTIYYYQMIVTDVNSNTATGDIKSFTTLTTSPITLYGNLSEEITMAAKSRVFINVINSTHAGEVITTDTDTFGDPDKLTSSMVVSSKTRITKNVSSIVGASDFDISIS